jgi:hypothetical protein
MISMGDDNQMQELRESRKRGFKEWDCARLGQIYLSAKISRKQTSEHDRSFILRVRKMLTILEIRHLETFSLFLNVVY